LPIEFSGPGVSPRAGAEISLEEAAPLLHAIVDDTLERAGGVLFTGFRVASIDAFQRFAGSFGHPLIGYEFASTPRSQVEGAVYTSTEYPPHRSIPLHNEQSYTREWPLRIWFHCALAARTGGATPIADSRAIYRALDPALVQRFTKRELFYVRNFGQGLDLPWEQAFGSDDPRTVERICRARGIAALAALAIAACSKEDIVIAEIPNDGPDGGPVTGASAPETSQSSLTSHAAARATSGSISSAS